MSYYDLRIGQISVGFTPSGDNVGVYPKVFSREALAEMREEKSTPTLEIRDNGQAGEGLWITIQANIGPESLSFSVPSTSIGVLIEALQAVQACRKKEHCPAG